MTKRFTGTVFWQNRGEEAALMVPEARIHIQELLDRIERLPLKEGRFVGSWRTPDGVIKVDVLLGSTGMNGPLIRCKLITNKELLEERKEEFEKTFPLFFCHVRLLASDFTIGTPAWDVEKNPDYPEIQAAGDVLTYEHPFVDWKGKEAADLLYWKWRSTGVDAGRIADLRYSYGSGERNIYTVGAQLIAAMPPEITDTVCGACKYNGTENLVVAGKNAWYFVNGEGKWEVIADTAFSRMWGDTFAEELGSIPAVLFDSSGTKAICALNHKQTAVDDTEFGGYNFPPFYRIFEVKDTPTGWEIQFSDTEPAYISEDTIIYSGDQYDGMQLETLLLDDYIVGADFKEVKDQPDAIILLFAKYEVTTTKLWENKTHYPGTETVCGGSYDVTVEAKQYVKFGPAAESWNRRTVQIFDDYSNSGGIGDWCVTLPSRTSVGYLSRTYNRPRGLVVDLRYDAAYFLNRKTEFALDISYSGATGVKTIVEYEKETRQLCRGYVENAVELMNTTELLSTPLEFPCSWTTTSVVPSAEWFKLRGSPSAAHTTQRIFEEHVYLRGEMVGGQTGAAITKSGDALYGNFSVYSTPSLRTRNTTCNNQSSAPISQYLHYAALYDSEEKAIANARIVVGAVNGFERLTHIALLVSDRGDSIPVG